MLLLLPPLPATPHMPGLLFIAVSALLSSYDAFRLGSSHHVIPLGPPAARRFQGKNPDQGPITQELVRTKRHSFHELVRVQPNLVHDMGWPEIQETTQAKVDSNTNASHPDRPPASRDPVRTHVDVEENAGVEDEMERMVHLVVPQDAETYRKQPDSTDPETGLFPGPGAGEASMEASGFYGTDTEDRDRGEEGGEERERRAGEDEWERDAMEDRERRVGEEEEMGEREVDDQDALEAFEGNHTTPDLDALIGYSPSLHELSSSKEPGLSSPVDEHESGPQEHRASPVQEGPLEGERWEAEVDEDSHSSGDGVLRSVTTAAPAGDSAAGDAAGTATPETDTGTDFGLLGGYTREEPEQEEEAEREEEEEEAGLARVGAFTQNPTAPEVGVAPSREPLQPSVEKEEEEEEEEELRRRKMEGEEAGSKHFIPLTTDASPTVGYTGASWDMPEKTTPLQERGSEVIGNGVTEVMIPFTDLKEEDQVVCVDWSKLSARGYVILDMTHNLNCEEFRGDQGKRLLKIMERVFARRMNSPEGSWVLYLSKPTHQQHQLLMNVASEHEVIATKDVLGMLGEIRKSLNKVGIQNYSAASSCQSRPSQTRSDYGKLFVVLVIIGSVCMVIITSGLIYICWQRRLPGIKTTFRAEELHFVENGCHDNPMLDVTNDSQPEMQEKKPSTNGLAGGGEAGGGESNRWQVFVNQAATEEEEEEEQDTHL